MERGGGERGDRAGRARKATERRRQRGEREMIKGKEERRNEEERMRKGRRGDKFMGNKAVIGKGRRVIGRSKIRKGEWPMD